MPTLSDIISAAPTISARPDSVAAIMEIIDDPVVSAEKLLPVIERDPGLAAGLLKLCNSSLFNVRRIIGTPREALVMVGNLAFARLCFVLSLEPMLHRHLPGYELDLDELWKHSLATAYGASFLMGVTGSPEQRDRAFTAGLLHDIGKLVLDRALSDSDAEAGAEVTPELERRRTGFDHAAAGAALLESWELPEIMVEAVRCHHAPTEAGPYERMARAVSTADQVSHLAVKLQTGSQALEHWVEQTFRGSVFGLQHIGTLAETISCRQQNILALAMNPRL